MFYCDSGRVNVLDSTTTNNPALSYNWDFGDGTTSASTNPSHIYTAPGLYNVKLIVTTPAGCIDSLTKGPVRIIQSPLISVDTDTVICINDRLLHVGIMDRPDTSLVQWAWTFPNGNTSNLQNPAIQQYTQAGTFQLSAIATNSSGCADTVTKSLLVHPLPFATLPPVITKVVGVPIILPGTYSSNAMNWVWTPTTDLNCTNCPQPVTSTRFNTKYTVIVEDSNTCKNSAQVQVIVTCPGTNIFIPNTFSPNADGANDVFYPRGTGLDRVKSLRIFNRWGQVVFEQTNFPVNNPSFGWDGTYKGTKALPDVYVYQAEIFCENSEVIRFEGNIALIK
jgi:gliding motility-associated-like protein